MICSIMFVHFYNNKSWERGDKCQKVYNYIKYWIHFPYCFHKFYNRSLILYMNYEIIIKYDLLLNSRVWQNRKKNWASYLHIYFKNYFKIRSSKSLPYLVLSFSLIQCWHWCPSLGEFVSAWILLSPFRS